MRERWRKKEEKEEGVKFKGRNADEEEEEGEIISFGREKGMEMMGWKSKNHGKGEKYVCYACVCVCDNVQNKVEDIGNRVHLSYKNLVLTENDRECSQVRAAGDPLRRHDRCVYQRCVMTGEIYHTIDVI